MSTSEVFQGAKVRRPTTCSRCKQVGHNKATCKSDANEAPPDPFFDLPNLIPIDADSDDEEDGDTPLLLDDDSVPEINFNDSNSDSSDEEGYLDPIFAEDQLPIPPGPQYYQEFTEGNWENFDVPLHTRRNTRGRGSVEPPMHPMKERTGAAANIPLGTRSMPDFLSLLLPDEILQVFCDATNSYVKNMAIPSWPEKNNLSVEELKAFFAVVLYQGIVQRPSHRMYWSNSSNIFSDPIVPSIMSYNRFNAISGNLHYVDTSRVSAAERTARNRADGFWTVSSFIEALVLNFQKYFECGTLISIDEMCIFFKGRHRCKCYNPMKPNKWHFKFFCLNDAGTGYLSNCIPYRGKDETRDPSVSATLAPLLNLTAPPMYHNKGNVLGIDNWYTSLDALANLSSEPRNMEVVGTCKTNRRGIPKSSVFPLTGRAKRLRGTIACKRAEFEGKNFFFTSWQDNKPVHMLSTFSPSISTCRRNTKEPGPNGIFVPLDIPRPTVIPVYNKAMGGTDKFDQFGSYYDDRKRSIKWHRRIFIHFIRAAVINAHILHNSSTKKTKDHLTLLKAIQSIIISWGGLEDKGHNNLDAIDEDQEDDEEDRTFLSPGEKRQRASRAVWSYQKSARLTGPHYPEVLQGSASYDCRGRCKVCTGKTRYKCQECDVYLHLKGSEGDQDCWKTFHTQDHF